MTGPAKRRTRRRKEQEVADVLLPDGTVTVTDPDTGGPTGLVVREFRFAEALRAQAEAQALLADLARIAIREDAGEGMTPVALDAVMGRHHDVWLGLCARATDRDAEWLGRLSDADGHRVSIAVWTTNADFFVARVLGQALGRTTMANSWDSLTSSTALSPQATAAPADTVQ